MQNLPEHEVPMVLLVNLEPNSSHSYLSVTSGVPGWNRGGFHTGPALTIKLMMSMACTTCCTVSKNWFFDYGRFGFGSRSRRGPLCLSSP